MRTLDPFIGPVIKARAIPRSKRGTGQLRSTMSSLQVGESFDTAYSRNACYRMASRLGIKVNCRATGLGKRIGVWRVS